VAARFSSGAGLKAIASFVTVLVLALGVGACAETDAAATRNAYVRQLNAAQERLARAATEVKASITDASSVRQDRRTLVRYGTTMGGIVKTLRTVAVPANTRPEHAALVAALAEFRTEITAIVIELRSPTTRAIDDADHRLRDATKTFDAKLGAAVSAINRKLRAG
jgi:hypothetical protein